MKNVEEYKEKMPKFYAKVLKQVSISEDHPMYTQYVNDAIWKYLFGDVFVTNLMQFIKIENLSVLDVGSGSGGISTAFARQNAKVTAIDVDEGYTKLAKIGYEENRVDVKTIIFDGSNYPFNNESFDIICFFNIFEHVPNIKDAFNEMDRVLKQGGIIVGRMDYKWVWKNIKSDPHYGLPISILLPRWLRKLLVINVFKRSKTVEDYKWASSFGAMKQLALKYNFYTIKYLDNIIFIKQPSNIFKIGTGIIDLDNHYCFNNWHDTEIWNDTKVRWSDRKSRINLLNISKNIRTIEFEVFSLTEKKLYIIHNDERIEHVVTNQWKRITTKLEATERFIINIDLEIKTSKVKGDKRNLGVAIRNLKVNQ